ncbi:putative class IV aminotransferase [Colletotrichum truncatum]|uniref:Class IV aminotransferase n=1 Tax=Colletotrichum truncatum TaxID=5467 RepID=A0ACC3YPM5_COLTU|nr:putative class IV aminotransferase [Colletotrichum truncatum]KAF6796887.1 putative class IV aminotransferase [Colletotrichum truncatum]
MAPSSIQDIIDIEPSAPVTGVKASKADGSHDNFQLFRILVPLVSNGKVTHLNAGFMPPSNLIVSEAIDRFCSQSLHSPSPKTCWREEVEALRKLLASYINTEPSSIAFVRDTTEGLGSFIHGLKFEKGDNVVILDCEHPNQAFGWLALQPAGLEVRFASTDPGKPTSANADTFAPYIDHRTKAIGLSSIMFHSGVWNNVADICSAYRPRGIHVLADLTQQVGFADVDVQSLGVSAAAFSLHKGLNTPTGLAALYVDSAVIEELDPTPPLVGYGGVSSVSDSEDFMIPKGPVAFHSTARRYEHANMSFISAVAARAFVQFYLGLMGPKKVENHLYSLGDALRRSCAGLGIGIVGPVERNQHAPHLYVLELHDPRWLDFLTAAEVYVTRFRSGIRVSFGFYNNLDDVKRLVSVLKLGLQTGLLVQET